MTSWGEWLGQPVRLAGLCQHGLQKDETKSIAILYGHISSRISCMSGEVVEPHGCFRIVQTAAASDG